MKNYKKLTDIGIACIIGVVILIGGIVVTIFSSKICANIISMISGLLSMIATVGIGIVAFLQNKKYKQQSDENNKNSEKKIYTPELAVQMIKPQSYKSSGMQEMTVTICDKSNYSKKSLVCVPLKNSILNLKIKNISFYNKKNGKTNNFDEFDCDAEDLTVLIPDKAFSLYIGFPNEYLSEEFQCDILITYNNAYCQLFEKKISLQMYDLGYEIVATKAEPAKMICD